MEKTGEIKEGRTPLPDLPRVPIKIGSAIGHADPARLDALFANDIPKQAADKVASTLKGKS